MLKYTAIVSVYDVNGMVFVFVFSLFELFAHPRISGAIIHIHDCRIRFPLVNQI